MYVLPSFRRVFRLLTSLSPVSVASITISNSRRRLLTLSPNAFPAVRFVAKRDAGDDTPIEYIQVKSLGIDAAPVAASMN